jgi:peptidoglycan hydrolase CwlO-like protein
METNTIVILVAIITSFVTTIGIVVALFSNLSKKIDAMNDKFDKKFDAINDKFDAINDKFDAINDRITKLEREIEKLHSKFDRLDERSNYLDKKIDEIKEMQKERNENTKEQVATINIRMDRIETEYFKHFTNTNATLKNIENIQTAKTETIF